MAPSVVLEVLWWLRNLRWGVGLRLVCLLLLPKLGDKLYELLLEIGDDVTDALPAAWLLKLEIILRVDGGDLINSKQNT